MGVMSSDIAIDWRKDISLVPDYPVASAA